MNHGGELFGHIAAAGLLDKPQHTRHRHHDGDDGHRHIVPLGRRRKNHVREGRHHCQQQQNQGKGVGKGFQQTPGRALPLDPGQAVGAVLLPGRPGLFVGQSRRGGAQLLHQFFFGAGGRCPQPCIRFFCGGVLRCRIGFDPFHHHDGFLPSCVGGRKKSARFHRFPADRGRTGRRESRHQAGTPVPSFAAVLSAVCPLSSTAGVHASHLPFLTKK